MSGARGVLAMSTANAAALLAAVGGYFAYSRILSPADFGLYAGALALARLGTALLDGGIRLSLIKEGGALTGGTYRSAFIACTLLALASIVGLALLVLILVSTDKLSLHSAGTLWLYATAYFATYPLLVIPLADLERGFRFGTVARAEGFTNCIEYALPAVLWICISPGFWSFVVSVWLARLLRAGLLLRGSAHRAWLTNQFQPDWPGLRRLLGTGFQFQLASVAATLRDSLHLILVGPMFGRDMAGAYAWTLQLCAITSQVFVQTTTRVSLPLLLESADDHERWQKTLRQILWLSVLTFPPLLCLQCIGPAVNHAFFQGKWTTALLFLPFLIARMLPGLATTPMGSLIIAKLGSRDYATANTIWSIVEFCVAIVFVKWLGVIGLALSYSIVVWFGFSLFAIRLGGFSAIVDVLLVVLLRPSIWVASIMTVPFSFALISLEKNLMLALAYSAFVCVISLSTESRARQLVQDQFSKRAVYSARK